MRLFSGHRSCKQRHQITEGVRQPVDKSRMGTATFAQQEATGRISDHRKRKRKKKKKLHKGLVPKTVFDPPPPEIVRFGLFFSDQIYGFF